MRTIVGKDVEYAKQLLGDGELAAIPTETVYGLAANALDARAVAKIVPGDDRPTRPVRDDRGVALVVRRTAYRHAIGGPQRHARSVHALRVDVEIRAVANVLPGDDDAARAIRDRRSIQLVARSGANRQVAVVGVMWPRRPDLWSRENLESEDDDQRDQPSCA